MAPPTPSFISVGARLRDIRRARHLSQQALGARIQHSQQKIFGWEEGRTRIPADLVPLLAWALEVPIMAFYPQPDETDDLNVLAQALPPPARQALAAFLRSVQGGAAPAPPAPANPPPPDARCD